MQALRNKQQFILLKFLLYSFLFTATLPAYAADEKGNTPVWHLDAGLGVPFTYNSASGATGSNDIRIGQALAAQISYNYAGRHFSLLASLARNQPVWQREDGLKNTDLCQESYGRTFFSFPGYCVQYQARLTPLAWFGNLAAGVSFAYNHFTDVSYRESRIFNTKWAYGAIGLAGAARRYWGRFSLIILATLDYGIFSIVLTPQKIQAWQGGVTIYGTYQIF